MKLLTYIIEGLIFPFVVVSLVCSKKNRASILERLGFGDWSNLRVSQKKRIWLHFASVGEGTGAKPIIQRLKKNFPELELVITTTSLTGKSYAKELSEFVYLLPIDNPFLIAKKIAKIKPIALLLFETELWPALTYQMAKRKVPIFVINARISDYSFKNYIFLKPIFKPVLQAFTHIFAQSEKDRERYIKLGVEERKIEVIGSTKYDFDTSEISKERRESFLLELGLDANKPCFIAGSVRPSEDEQVILAYQEVQKKYSDLQMIIAPRHPERFSSVAELLAKYEIVFHKRSAGKNENDSSVILLDTLGELNLAYSVASMAFIGGTLVDIGGHNPMEPARYVIPVIVGPHTSNIEDALVSLEAHKAYLRVRDANDLAQTIFNLLSSSALYKASSEGAYRAWQQQQGSSDKVFTMISEVLK